MQPWPLLYEEISKVFLPTCGKLGLTYERTKRSRFNHLGFLGLNFMNLLNKTWATGAIPLFSYCQWTVFPSTMSGGPGGVWVMKAYMGAPGWPEFDLAVASACGELDQHVFLV